MYLKTYLSNTPNTVDQIQIQIQIHGLKFDQIQIQIRRICICICKYKYVFDPSPALRWVSCGPGTGLQAHPLKSQNRFGKKSSVTNNTKLSYEKHPCQTSPTASGHFTLQAEPENKLKQLYFNGAMSTFSWQSLHLPKNKQPKWQLLWSQDPLDYASWFPLPSLGQSPMENPMIKGYEVPVI